MAKSARRKSKIIVPPSESVRQRALEASSKLAPIEQRMSAWAGLCAQVSIEIRKKLESIRSAHEYQNEWAADQERLETLRESMAELEGSSKLGRAIEDLKVLRTSMGEVVGALEKLTGERS